MHCCLPQVIPVAHAGESCIAAALVSQARFELAKSCSQNRWYRPLTDCELYGVRSGTRTHKLKAALFKNAAVTNFAILAYLVPVVGFEPTTSYLQDKCSTN